MRLNQYLAHAGLGSRRSVEPLIESGRVTVDGSKATLQSRISPGESDVRFDGAPVKLPLRLTYILLHKPVGYSVTRSDPHAERSVYELLPKALQHLAYVGRLDRESEGLLLFCNDGVLAHRLLLPSYRIEREYRVAVTGAWRDELAQRMLQGVQGDGPPLAARQVEVMSILPHGAELRIVLTEGKKREVRRLCAHVHLKVSRLRRLRFGPLELRDLLPGRHRELSEDEVTTLRRLVGLAK